MQSSIYLIRNYRFQYKGGSQELLRLPTLHGWGVSLLQQIMHAMHQREGIANCIRRPQTSPQKKIRVAK